MGATADLVAPLCDTAAMTTTVAIDDIQLEVQHVAAPADAHTARPLAPLLFLHEGLGSIAMWRNWPARVCAATGRAGWMYSRRGYGRSSRIDDVRGRGRLPLDYLHREALQVLPKLLQRLGLEQPPVLIGHSDGATIALLHAAHHDVPACVVMAPHLMVEPETLAGLRRARQAYESGHLRERLARYHDDVDSAFWQWNDAWLNPAFQAFDIREECRGIEAPLLAVQGEDDEYATLAQLDELARVAPQAQRLVLARCGHVPHRDQAATVTRAIADFLAG